MSRTTEELNKTLQLIKMERQADLEYYKNKVLYRSLQERKKEGVCWHPVIVRQSYFSSGERLMIEIERTTDLNKSHVFNSGKVIRVFRNPTGKQEIEESITGVVNFSRENKMVITLNSDELPEWMEAGKIGIDLLFDEATYIEMENALNKVLAASNNRLSELREIILGEMPCQFNTTNYSFIKKLNLSQNEAMSHVLNAKDIAVIHGPPGTGKTTTLIQAIFQRLKEEPQVMVTASSNAAVDLLTEKLIGEGVNVLRLGHPARVTENIISRTLDAQLANHKRYNEVKMLRKKAEELLKLAGKYKRNFGRSEKEQRQRLKREARDVRRNADASERYIISSIIENNQVFACTLTGANHYLLERKFFHTIFIDEAAQALEPACWIPIIKAHKVIFAGDHQQLPPTIKSFEAAKEGLSKTLMEKCIKKENSSRMLRMQYRMNELIMNFSNRYFYKNQLEAYETVKNHQIFPDEHPVEFIDTAGCGFTEKMDEESLSRYNIEEADLLLRQLKQLMEKIGEESLETISIGIISPYKSQVQLLTTKASEIAIFESNKNNITINTVDAFQGQERDIIAISMVRSNDIGEIGFLGDERRMNVAMTRARKKLIMVGDSATLASSKFYQELFDYLQEINGYRSAWEITK